MRRHLLPYVLAIFAVAGIEAQTQPTTSAAPVGEQASKFEISFGVSGNPGPDDDLNPLTVAYKKWPRRSTQLLGFINYRQPKSFDEIQPATSLPPDDLKQLLSDLEKCGLIHGSPETGYRVTFVVFDDELWKSFEPIMSKTADQIADRILGERIQPLRSRFARSDVKKRGLPFGVLANVVIGSFGLDETAISALQGQDLMWLTKTQPGGRHYVLLAQRNQRTAIHRLYGIHSGAWANVRYYTYGENGAMNAKPAEMHALPDIAWQWHRTGAKSGDDANALLSPLGELVTRFGNAWFSAAQASSVLPHGQSRRLLQELTSDGLLEQKSDSKYRAAFVVFSKHERDRFRADSDATAAIAVEIMKGMYPEFAEVYSRSAPAAQQIPMQEVMDMVYHRTYSLALERMFSRFPEFGYSEEHGDLRFTPYAILQHN